MNEYVDKYLEYLLYQKKYSENTITSFEEDLEFFKKFLEENKANLLKVDYAIIKRFYNYMDSLGFSKSTISRKVSSLRSFYKYLARNNYIAYNPFSLTKGPKKDKLLPKFLYYN